MGHELVHQAGVQLMVGGVSIHLEDVVMAVGLQEFQFIQTLGDVEAGVVQVGVTMLGRILQNNSGSRQEVLW